MKWGHNKAQRQRRSICWRRYFPFFRRSSSSKRCFYWSRCFSMWRDYPDWYQWFPVYPSFAHRPPSSLVQIVDTGHNRCSKNRAVHNDHWQMHQTDDACYPVCRRVLHLQPLRPPVRLAEDKYRCESLPTGLQILSVHGLRKTSPNSSTLPCMGSLSCSSAVWIFAKGQLKKQHPQAVRAGCLSPVSWIPCW